MLPNSPFQSVRYIGSIVHVEPSFLRLNLPHAGAAASDSHFGQRLGKGEVGEFVLFEGETHAVLGRITQIRLPEGERLSVEPKRGEDDKDINPVGVVQLLLSINILTGKIIRGIPEHPRIGQRAYSAHADIVKYAIEDAVSSNEKNVLLAHLPTSETTHVTVKPSAMFGRHCAVLGTTGGGKSWTVARLLGEIARNRGKAVIFDPSGEFHTLNDRVRHVYLGGNPSGSADTREFVCFPHRHLADADLFAMFQPSGGSQSPKLREALISLKLIRQYPSLAQNGLLVKCNKSKAAFDEALVKHSSAIRAFDCDYDISRLADQIYEECVWPTTQNAPGSWGGYDQNSRGYCTTLVSRVALQVSSDEMASIFNPASLPDITDVLNAFLFDNTTSILRVSMEYLPFEHNTRELVANALGRFLLHKAREGLFKNQPLIVFLDEAHQFLNKTIGDEYNRHRLEAFGVIAKEGRKYGLLTVLATQRPRDIPEDVLSQMGMFIVHRLINDRDRQVVEGACGSLDASAAAFLPVLGQGEALVVGLDTPMIMPVQVLRPQDEPDSTDLQIW